MIQDCKPTDIYHLNIRRMIARIVRVAWRRNNWWKVWQDCKALQRVWIWWRSSRKLGEVTSNSGITSWSRMESAVFAVVAMFWSLFFLVGFEALMLQNCWPGFLGGLGVMQDGIWICYCRDIVFLRVKVLASFLLKRRWLEDRKSVV